MSTANSKGTVVITGASSGIGAVYADRFAKRGYNLLLIARDTKRLTSIADTLTAEYGIAVETLAADLTDRSSLLALETRLKADDTISILVNNAGFGGTKSLTDSDVDELENMIFLNVTALTRLTAAVLPSLIAKKAGAVINIASVVAVNPDVLNGTYSGSKAYVLSFTQSLFKNLKDTGVQVQAVLPGATRTEFWDRAGLPVHNLPEKNVMSAEDCVDAALVAFDQKELVTIPALPDVEVWNRYEQARLALYPFLSSKEAAPRYRA
ncbi:SDR family NAD(P)-dependent oxidoreductase [Granulicella cerasi]|uniref:SDR family NAD(P)-dependent oxidoreductase n=1 Tax=Granulicella cerasi TaxID=741063 RepID=A0ABW1Z790_9BACT|nr:SDR family oxidoreductase [Granulicella cerasi]